MNAPFNNSYFIIFGGIITLITGITLPWWIQEKVLHFIAYTLIPNDAEWYMTKFNAEFGKAVTARGHLPLPMTTSLRLYKQLAGIGIKLLWSFTW